jgi:KDO2-lipid IV(A) lauroyltransferase
LYKLWMRGGHAGLVADRVFGTGERPGPFLAGMRRFPSAGMDLARRAGAALVPVFLLREGDGYVLRVHPPLPAEEDPVPAFARALEVEVCRHPQQWCLLYPACDAAAMGVAA